MTIDDESRYKCHKNLTVHLTDPQLISSIPICQPIARLDLLTELKRAPARFNATHNCHGLSIDINRSQTAIIHICRARCNHTSGQLVAKPGINPMTIAGRVQISRLRAGARSNDLTASISKPRGPACTRARESVSFCQVATQVSFYVPRLLAQSHPCLSLPVLSLGSSRVSSRRNLRLCPDRTPKDANAPLDSLLRPHRRS